MKNYLLITLGHNSSAIFVDNSDEAQQIIGYEQERLSGIKSDSQFPIDAINEIIRNTGIGKIKNCAIRISHWFNDVAHFKSIPNKYITENDIDFLRALSSDIKLVNEGFSHHDAHAYSAYAFFKYHLKDRQYSGKLHCLVVDGFGTNEEVLSLYECDKSTGNLNLVHRVCNLQASLGLLYQYATSFVGMKENQDEYKFLGYESHIDEVCKNVDIEIISMRANKFSNEILLKLENNTPAHSRSLLPYSIIDYIGLESAREAVKKELKSLLSHLDSDSDSSSFKARCVVAYFVQSVCENVLKAFIKKHNVHNLIVTGGTFYNVKLNNALLNTIDGLFCAMPLAGDQGAAIGMYVKEMQNEKPFNFGNLCWGKRRLYNVQKILEKNGYTRATYTCPITKEDTDLVAKTIAKHIADGDIVNIVGRYMEFGPRALCSTSTIFLPTSDNAHCNNHMNGRNEVMPCAPICTEENAVKLFGRVELDRVIGSDRFMICTHTYNKPYSSHYGGVMHKKPLSEEHTGRPQIIRKGIISEVLKLVERMTDYKALVNTSFNVHGRPIAFDTMSILENYAYQCEHAFDLKKPYLFIIDC